MKNFTLLLITILSLPFGVGAQNNSKQEPHFEVNRIYPYITVTKDQLQSAQTLMDLNPRFKNSWVKTYLSVELLTMQQGKQKKTISKNEMLTTEQKHSIAMADEDTEISIKVRYLPDNNLQHNDPKEEPFSFTIQPDKDASYEGGLEKLNQYLLKEAITKIPEGTFTEYKLAAIKFTIDESGEVTNVHVFESCKNEQVDQLLLKTIQNMPCWQPASYKSGLTAKQEFALTVGNHENCMIYTLGTRRFY